MTFKALLALLTISSILTISGCAGSMDVTASPEPIANANGSSLTAPGSMPDLTSTPVATPVTGSPTATTCPTANPTPVQTGEPSATPVPTLLPTPVPTGKIHFRVIPAPVDVPDSQWIDIVTVAMAGGPTYSGKSLVGDFFDVPYGQYPVSATVVYIENSNGNLTTYVYKNIRSQQNVNVSWESMGLQIGCDLVSKTSIPLPTPSPTPAPTPAAGTISYSVIPPGDAPSSVWLDRVTVTLRKAINGNGEDLMGSYSGKEYSGTFADLPFDQYYMSATIAYNVKKSENVINYIYVSDDRFFTLNSPNVHFDLNCREW